MRKWICLTVCAGMLAGCGSNDDKGEAIVKTGSGEIKAVVEMEGDQVKSVAIDESENGSSKKDAGDDYGLKEYSNINKEWYEQIEFLERYLKENGSEGLAFDAQGRAQNADVASGCTISIEKYVNAYEQAKADAMK